MRHLAVIRDRVEAVQTLVDWKADQELADSNGLTALQRAVQRGHVACVQLLYAPEREPRRWQERSIYWAVLGGHTEVVQLLLHGLEASEKQRALLLAAAQGQPQVVGQLLEARASVERQARDGATALSAAVTAGHLEAEREA